MTHDPERLERELTGAIGSWDGGERELSGTEGEDAERLKREKAKMRKWKDHGFHGFHGWEIEGARTEGRNQKPHAKDAKVAKDQRTAVVEEFSAF